MRLSRDTFLVGLLTAIGGAAWKPGASIAVSRTACPPSPQPGPHGEPGPVNLNTHEKVILGEAFALALTIKPHLRDEFDQKAALWRAHGDPHDECGGTRSRGGPPVFEAYRDLIYRAVPSSSKRGGLYRGDVADVLWVSANLLLSLASAVSGYGDELKWPAEPVPVAQRRQAAARKAGVKLLPAHMVPLPVVGGSHIVQCDLDFPLPAGMDTSC